MIILPYHFQFRDYQRELFKAYFINRIKRLIAVWHRRGGKSKSAINFLTTAACERKGVYYHMFPQLNQARKVIWQGIDSDGFRYIDHVPKKLVGHVHNQEMLIELVNGSILQLASADRYDAVMGSNPLGVVFDEYSLNNPLAWHYIEPILTENNGWALFIYTPRGRNHGFRLYDNATRNKEWFTQKLSISDTRRLDGSFVISPADVDSIRLSGTPEELIEQEYYCSFEAALVGSYYGKLMKAAQEEGRICHVPVDPKYPLFSFWDIGIADAMAIWTMQAIGNSLNFVDYYENNGEGIRHYIDYLKDFSRKTGGKYKAHFAPHDAQQRDWVTGLSRLELARKEGINFHLVPKLLIADGIEAVRALLPYCRFDSVRCQIGINFLTEYHKKYNEITNIYDDKPAHDYASHGADAFRYFAIIWKESLKGELSSIPRQIPYWPAV